MGKRFEITVTYTTAFDVSELWPDGDAPANPTEADVLALVHQCGGGIEVVRDWGLEADEDVQVRMVSP